ncbi:hypothetical protein LPTSP2_39320 [Leptospira ellinghausenii]|uniref:Uncharacterized protein n=1 Tax=Leptospira ellinghausenii TaxID=1917822 RepID=A0A2P2DJ54_9LEPT|nr:hypothetical protein [Leptospira ellinghausenii]GBF44629.1 hypothetical protein LPTSP2_39320 [Leptospira ellinghausenii]
MEINLDAFEFAIARIEDGFIFEEFLKQFLSGIYGTSFIPVGGTKDKGIDGFQHILQDEHELRTIYQISTELDFEGKINNTLNKLISNSIKFERIYYITNRDINNKDILQNDFYLKNKKQLIIHDFRWFSSNCNANSQTISSFNTFCNNYLHEYNKPGKSYIVADLDSDSRLFTFLRQQFDSKGNEVEIEDMLIETLILFSLEDTDPITEKLLSKDEIKDKIKQYIKFDLRLLESKIDKCLLELNKKPRKIQYHSKLEKYCLPYETRKIIQTRNLKDLNLHQTFNKETTHTIKKYFQDQEVSVKDIQALIDQVFAKIFHKQGLDFSNFVLHGDNQAIVEQNLNDVISEAVDSSAVILKNKEKVKTSLHVAIRDIVYNGTENQRNFLKSLSNTYLMMFLLNWDPKIAIFFKTLAAKLSIFVDNSIIVPALSEYYLPLENRRHWNLLKGAKKAGITLYINETLLQELVHHLKSVKFKYQSLYQNNEEIYLDGEFEFLYIDEILIRSYFYAKMRNHVKTFDQYLDNFITPDLRNVREELIVFIKEEFGIEYITNEKLKVTLDPSEKEKLSEYLTKKKQHEIKAKNDAEMILTIYNIRNRNSESAETGIFGYKTWWLSKDTATYKAVTKVFGEKYPISCYIRPDFIYNYIALLPHTHEVNEAYNKIFPTMLGVNLSYHMPSEVSQTVQEKLKEFHSKKPVRVKQILRTMTDKLKSEPDFRNKVQVEHYLDQILKEIEDK